MAMLELVKLWALVEVLGLLCLPLTVTVFHNLPDRGWAFSKALGITVFSFAVWFPLMCFQSLPYSPAFLWGVAIVLAVASIAGFWPTWRTVKRIVREHRSYVILSELVFVLMVALLGFMRQLRPDVRSWEGFMDEGMLAGIMRSPHLPPNDIWYSGSSINYYYYAHFAIATLAKMIGQAPAVLFNTGICIFFGLTAVNLFGVTSNIVAWAKMRSARANADIISEKGEPLEQVQATGAVSHWRSPLLQAAPFGLCSLAFGVIIGNLASFTQWVASQKSGGAVYEWFNPSRVIPSTINEFPSFSFLLSDFHAHVLTLAFTIMAIGLAFNFLLERDGTGLGAFGRGWQMPCTLLAGALLLGQLFVMNGWDYPTYLGLALLCLILQQWLAHKGRFSLSLLLDLAISCVALAAISLLLFVPFFRSFISPAQGIGFVTDAAARSPLVDEILIYGFFIFMLLSFLFVSFLHERRNAQAELPTRWWLDAHFLMAVVTLLFAIVSLLLLKNSLTFVVLGSISILSFWLGLYHLHERGRSFALLLGGLACALIAACEVIFLKDVFAGGEYFRMNTVFKFYFQAWALLAVGCGCALYFVGRSIWPQKDSLSAPDHEQLLSSRARKGLAIPWLLCLALLTVASLFYPVLAPAARLATYDSQTQSMKLQSSWSLDGMTYLQSCRPPDSYPDLDSDPSTFCLADVTHDYAALRWINAHIQGDPVIVEAANATDEDYSLHALVSSFTGLPTIMGWPGHEVQWRATWLQDPDNAAIFNQRITDVGLIYTSTDQATVLSLLHKYHATYLYVGSMERLDYPQANLARFATFLPTVYNAQGVAIYKVPA